MIPGRAAQGFVFAAGGINLVLAYAKHGDAAVSWPSEQLFLVAQDRFIS